jgi:Ala-tRNA(Pro) deacylase
MPIQKLRQFLDVNLVKYVVITHSMAYTAQGVAASAHISGNELAKTVMLKKDGQLCMAVLPASKHVNLEAFAKLTQSGDVCLASEREFKDRFPDCEVGAMPPFGNLYGLPVYVDNSLARDLTRDNEIAFNAGSHLELIQLAYEDFERLVNPSVGDFTSRSVIRAA